MISVLLDENKFFTGSYSLTGDISGGTLVKTLPPEENQLCYKYDIQNSFYLNVIVR